MNEITARNVSEVSRSDELTHPTLQLHRAF